MGIDYQAVMFYGVELSGDQVDMLISQYAELESLEGTDEREYEIENFDFGYDDLNLPNELECVRLSHWYDGDRHNYLVIKCTNYQSDDYGQLVIKENFEVNYSQWNKLLQSILGKKTQGHWHIMTRGS